MYEKFFKRLLDFAVAIFALPFVLLIIVIMAPIIRACDGGPVFYNEFRRGKDGKPFKMFKLRSMYVNSPEIINEDGSAFNSETDARVTPVGRFMRKTSLDEIPQLLNVLLGQMSFVGPRPTLTRTPYNELDEAGKYRLKVRPGITGYSQAYYRNSITQEEKFQYDCYYVDNVSFNLDIKILLRTIVSVLKSKDIYAA